MGPVRETLCELLSQNCGGDVQPALEGILSAISDIVEIDADQPWRQIVRDASQVIVDFLGGQAAVFRIRERSTGRMAVLASYRMPEDLGEDECSFEDDIVAEVVSTNQSRYVTGQPCNSFSSILFLPVNVRSMVDKEEEVRGVLVIYYPQPVALSPLEIHVAEMMALKVGYVLARRRIIEMKRMAQKKEWIVEKVFAKLSLEKGLKMKDLFRMMVDELYDIIKIQSCTLFAISDDGAEAVLETGWPEVGSYHSVGGVFRLDEHPHLAAAVRLDQPMGDFTHERIYNSYILVKNPYESRLTSPDLKRFAVEHGIYSILYVPLRIGDNVRYLLVFDALEKKKAFSDEDIEILTFFGKELTQALEIERLDDILHDFKNPAIAIAGFARRVKKMVESDATDKKTMLGYIDIVINEGTRLQEMAMSLFPVSRPEILDFAEVVKERFVINREAISESRSNGVTLTESGLDRTDIKVRTSRMALQRVLDNLFNNATKAIPQEGGDLSVNVYPDNVSAVAEITNTGRISDKALKQIIFDETRGRGLGIVNRLVSNMGGNLAVEVGEKTTTFRINLPLYRG
ncbi:hypothetical protein EPN96_08635 [bacterium]|nr:MAG: hypothetical protein EPN96_08635 [bacterium]